MQLPENADGTRVGRYQLVERLAVGGMAEVYLACQRGQNSLERLVVIKRILPHLAESAEFIEAFQREARIAARISHPNVVQIFELGEAGGLPFIAMEYVPGSTLKHLVKVARVEQVRLSADVAIHLVMQACAGAHAAHELTDPAGHPYGLVHRDISPHNLMVDDGAHVKLLDFGIAKAGQGMDHTRTGMLKGKISYMSPEQCRQDKLDRRSDVFSLGIVAYELLTGSKPFGGSSELATMQAIVLGKFDPLRDHRPDLPSGVVDAIEKCLAVDREDRWDTADALRRELRRAALEAGLEMDPDRASLLVRTLLGERHASRQRAIEGALERTLVSLTGIPPLVTETLDDNTSKAQGERTLSASSTTRSSVTDERARRAVAAGGVMASVGALVGLVGVAAAILAIAGAIWVAQRSPALAEDAVEDEPMVALEGEPIRVLVAPTMAPAELVENHEPIRRYLERTMRRPFSFEVADSYEAASRAVIDDEVPYALLPYNTTRVAHDEQPGIQILVVKVVDGSASTDGYLLVRRDEKAGGITELAGRTICYSDHLSNTGYNLPRQFIEAAGMDPDTDFQTHMSGNHQQLLEDLLNGTCDVAGTYSGNFNTADQRDIPTAQLRILAITGSTPHDALVAGARTDRDEAQEVRAALLAFDPERDIGVARVGESELITGFEPPPTDYLTR